MKKTEFRKNTTIAIADAFMKYYNNEDGNHVKIETTSTYSHVDLKGKSVCISVNINNREITYIARDYLYNSVRMKYYEYNENDILEEITKRVKKDFYKLAKDSNKYGHLMDHTLIGEFVERIK